MGAAGDEDRLEQLSKSPTGDGVIRFLIELRCEKLRPRLLRLAERLDDQPPKAAPTLVKALIRASFHDRLLLRRYLSPPQNASERISE